MDGWIETCNLMNEWIYVDIICRDIDEWWMIYDWQLMDEQLMISSYISTVVAVISDMLRYLLRNLDNLGYTVYMWK